MKTQGFTLIELIIVIVLLGILAATALPRFVDFSTDAKKAALQHLYGTVVTASEMAHLACQVSSSCNVGILDDYENIPSIGQTIRFQYGYPDAGNCAGSNGNEIDAMLDLTDFECVTEWPWISRFSVKGTTNCYVSYDQCRVAGGKPTITIVDSGC